MSVVCRAAILGMALFLSSGLAARADGIQTSATITLNALDGEHAINGGDVARINFVPLPLIELAARRHADELHVEGLPPVAFSYGRGSAAGLETTRLSIGNASYRRSLGGGFFAGIGQTLYNQHTTYAIVPGAYYTRYHPVNQIFPLTGAEEQFSRVTGMRLEAGRRWKTGRTELEAVVAGNPAMHGVQYTYIPSGPASPTFADPEHAAQVDVELRAYRAVGHGRALVYGLRYLHYCSTYDQDPGQLADRNLGLAPVIGYGVKL